MNALAFLSAVVFDPEDGTISTRSGAFVSDEIRGWLGRHLVTATALQIAIAAIECATPSDGHTLDDP